MITPQTTGEATYCPEDNKLRLYVGRVPRDEYLALRDQGWTSTPKQSCDFVAVWTPEREDTALAYGDGFIGDEDQDPGERAAERAERFSGYLGKRLSEAGAHADTYEDGPSVHGYQDPSRAERAAARHDRQADKAVTQWGKAEYWQTRTAGVIAHALYKDLPGVRMGRIKTIEAEQRKNLASRQKARAERVVEHSVMLAIVEHAEGKREKLVAYPGYHYSICYIRDADGMAEDAAFTPAQLRRIMAYSVFSGYYSDKWSAVRKDVEKGIIQGEDAARLWLDAHGWEAPAPFDPEVSRWYRHYTLRLSYENQMLEAQGGRLEQKDVEVGGYLGGKLIMKVSKSTATKRVTSCGVIYKSHRSGNRYDDRSFYPGTDYRGGSISLERIAPDAYTPPTPESLAELEAIKKELKAADTTPAEPPLINLTNEDAEKLQALWNRNAKVGRSQYSTELVDSTVIYTTQKVYSENSKGTYARTGAEFITTTGEIYHKSIYGKENRERAFKTRVSSAENYGQAKRVIVITDKPQKPLPITLSEEVSA